MNKAANQPKILWNFQYIETVKGTFFSIQVHLGFVMVLLVCPDRPPDVPVCWAHGLLFVVGAMCSPVYCLSPPILLPNHCFSCSTCVSLVTLVCLPISPPGVCSPVLIRCFTSCVFHVCLFCGSLPACLPACLFFPFGGVFCLQEKVVNYYCTIEKYILCIWILTSIFQKLVAWQGLKDRDLL